MSAELTSMVEIYAGFNFREKNVCDGWAKTDSLGITKHSRFDRVVEVTWGV